MCQTEIKAECGNDNLAYVQRHSNLKDTFFGDDFAVIILPDDQKVTNILPVTLNYNKNIPANTGDTLEAFGLGATDAVSKKKGSCYGDSGV